MDLGATFDEFQSKLIVENIRAGLAAVNKLGCRGGGSHSIDDENSPRRVRAASFRELLLRLRCHQAVRNRESSVLGYLPPEPI